MLLSLWWNVTIMNENKHLKQEEREKEETAKQIGTRIYRTSSCHSMAASSLLFDWQDWQDWIIKKKSHNWQDVLRLLASSWSSNW
ncbi:hypothetical protein SDJN02_21488, partial [Cucurbita argyrosperma subsp. argyrosperma]